MKTSTKVWLLVAAFLILIGCILFACVMTSLGWDFSKLSTSRLETNSYEITDAFDRISIQTNTADIVLAPSGDGTCRVECREREDERHTVRVQGDTLTVEQPEQDSIWNWVGLHLDAPRITVYLPETTYAALSLQGKTGNVTIPSGFAFQNVWISFRTGNIDCSASADETFEIQTTTGDIRVSDLTAAAIELTVSTGQVTVDAVQCAGRVSVNVSTGRATLTNLTCDSLTSSGTTGDLVLHRVLAVNTITAKRSTGDVTFDDADAAEIFVETSTGNVTGTLRSDKVFQTSTRTGDIRVPDSAAGGACSIKTSTGNIAITITK